MDTRDSAVESARGRGVTVWLTGLPSAGKSTIAEALATRLRSEGRRVEILDGDDLRTTLSADLGYSRDDRRLNVQRIGEVARRFSLSGAITLAAVIAPYEEDRETVRQGHLDDGAAYLEVHIATPLETCAKRDVRGLYAKQAAGTIVGLTGVDAPYEPPRAPDLTLRTEAQSVAESAAKVFDLLVERKFAW